MDAKRVQFRSNKSEATAPTLPSFSAVACPACLTCLCPSQLAGGPLPGALAPFGRGGLAEAGWPGVLPQVVT